MLNHSGSNHSAEQNESGDKHPKKDDTSLFERGEELDFSFVMAATVHDMKNSLGMLLTSLEEVIGALVPEDTEKHHHFSILQYEASRINSELIQLLTLYRVKEHNLPFGRHENYIIETFEDQVARNDVLFGIRGIDVQFHADEDLMWRYDNELIGNVIHNVLINAARYAKKAIQITATTQNNELKISIEDDGNGFPEFMLNNVDDENSVCAASTEFTASNSTRLGLFFAAKIAAMHQTADRKGRIKLSNGGGLGGGVFDIYIP